MLHVHRQITMLPDWDVHVIAQRVENIAQFPIASLDVVPRSSWRWAGRLHERIFHHGPWQAGRHEVDRVLEKLRANQSEILHLFFGNVAVHWLPLLRKIDLPVVVSFHGADVAGAIAGAEYRAAREEVFARATVIACRSEALAARVAAMGAPKEKIRITRTVIPVPDNLSRTPSATTSQTLLQASRLVPKKGLATTLRAFARISKNLPAAHLVIAGEGPLEADLRIQTQDLGVADRVRFAGFLNQPQLTAEFSQAAVFTHPSESIHGDTEGVPNSMLEAMAAGVPVVATRHGGIVEAVEDGVTGFLVDERDDAALADRLLMLLTNPDLNTRMGEAAQASIRTVYSEAASAADLSALYHAVIDGVSFR